MDLQPGDFCRAKTGNAARYVGEGKCVYVSAMTNDLFLADAIPAEGDEAKRVVPDMEDVQFALARLKRGLPPGDGVTFVPRKSA